ncbi:MAG TPA: peptidase M48 [Gammaproteobacteria bacterium]|nr:peptidase M48 [Gammaproteobacteria bacterium]
MNSLIWYRHAFANRIQSFLLLLAMSGFLALLGAILWGNDGVIALLFMGLMLVLLNPVITPQLIMRMYRARLLSRSQAPALHAALEQLAQRAELPMTPVLYYIPSRMVNAFAVGTRRQSAIAVSDGLLRILETRETIGVLAHEISHIQNNDMWVMGIADMFSRLTSMLSLFGQLLLLLNLPLIIFSAVSINWIAILILIFAPSLSALAQLGLSRTREYDADLNAVHLTGDPEGLARALLKIERQQGSFMERIFLPGRRIPDPSLLRTHPPTEERVRRLMELQHDGSVTGMNLPASGFMPDAFANNPAQRPPRWHINGLWH